GRVRRRRDDRVRQPQRSPSRASERALAARVQAPAMSESLLLTGATIVSCDAKDRVHRGDLLIRDGRIAAIGKLEAPRGVRRLDVSDRIVLPGLVMTHVHLCQALLRGMADDLPLLSWLADRIWPLEAAHDERTLRT